MAGSAGLIPGAVVGILGLVVAGALVLLTYRFSRGRSMATAMVQTAFLPEKRQRFLVLMSIEGAVVLLIAIVWGLTEQGWLPGPLGSTVTAGLLIVATVAVLSLTWLGYAPTHLTAEERRSLASQAPEVFQSLVMAPLQVEGGTTEFGGRSRPRVRAAPGPHPTGGRTDPETNGPPPTP